MRNNKSRRRRKQATLKIEDTENTTIAESTKNRGHCKQKIEMAEAEDAQGIRHLQCR